MVEDHRMKDIAVVIPVYNGARLLTDCVESVCTAGKRISEIIIVDDGSTDDTLQTAHRISVDDPRIKVIHTENHGTYMARTAGMKAATADYVTSIDTDDRYFPGCLDMLADLLEEYDADVAMGKLVETDDYDVKPVVDEPTISISTAEQMWPRIMKWKTQEFVCYINKLYKREILPDFVDADGICQGEDVLLTCQTFLSVKKIVETTAPMYLYYLNPVSLTHAGFGDRDLDVLRVWDKVVQISRKKRPDLLFMARFNRWRSDFTMISRLILADDKKLDKKYSQELKKWRSGLRKHWKTLAFSHVMPKNRELLVIGLRFLYYPTKILMRFGKRLVKKDVSVILHSGDKR